MSQRYVDYVKWCIEQRRMYTSFDHFALVMEWVNTL